VEGERHWHAAPVRWIKVKAMRWGTGGSLQKEAAAQASEKGAG
jgi:hypothetical protein